MPTLAPPTYAWRDMRHPQGRTFAALGINYQGSVMTLVGRPGDAPPLMHHLWHTRACPARRSLAAGLLASQAHAPHLMLCRSSRLLTLRVALSPHPKQDLCDRSGKYSNGFCQ